MPGQIAQLVEHRTENPGVGSSILPLPIALRRYDRGDDESGPGGDAFSAFRAFTVHLNDGRSYLIKHPDFISYSPNNREMTVHDEQGVHHIDMDNVSEVHVPRSPADASSNGG